MIYVISQDVIDEVIVINRFISLQHFVLLADDFDLWTHCRIIRAYSLDLRPINLEVMVIYHNDLITSSLIYS